MIILAETEESSKELLRLLCELEEEEAKRLWRGRRFFGWSVTSLDPPHNAILFLDLIVILYLS
jgi:hypothetical protein